MTTSMGMTESAPFAISSPVRTSAQVNSGCHARHGDQTRPTAAARTALQGPNITPGYWRNPGRTREAFDDEGFFCSGDAVQWSDPDDLHRGIRFDGRIAEDSSSPRAPSSRSAVARGKIIGAGAPLRAGRGHHRPRRA